MTELHKAKGNEAFKAQNFEEAIEHFSNAIAADPNGHVLYSNRSASYASLHKYAEALEDAEMCILLNASWGKGYSRKGAALIGLDRLEEALDTYEAGLKHEPTNAMLQSGADEVKSKLAGGGANAIGNMFSDPGLFGKLASNPQTASFLGQPDFIAKINELQRDPSALNKHLQDPRIMQVLGMLMGVNMQSADSMGDMEREAPAPSKAAEPEPEPMEEDLSEEELALRAQKKEAEAAKEQGNAAYKAKRFDEAIEHYNKAREVMPTEMTYLTNLAAVYFEEGAYQKSVDTCVEAIKLGREQRADYKNVAKAYARQGNALVKLGQYEAAVKAYDDSLLENRTEDVERRQRAAKKELKLREDQAYLSDQKAAEAKEKGNALFKEGKFVEAIEFYSEVRARCARSGGCAPPRRAPPVGRSVSGSESALAPPCLPVTVSGLRLHLRA
jgi:stress-induced-phosphoprotein 1